MESTPLLSTTSSVRSKMMDLFIPLLFLLPMAFFYGGTRALLIIALSVLSCVVTEAVWMKFRKLKPTIGDFSAIVTGLIIAYMLPSGIPLWIPVVGGIFAIAVAKMPFGGSSHCPFNPAAAAMAFLIVCWPMRIFGFDPVVYMKPFTLAATEQADTVTSVASALRDGAMPDANLLEMLFGNAPGAIGTTGVLVIIACCGFLMYRRVSMWMVPASFVAACSLVALIMPRGPAVGLESVAYELMSGSLLFCAVFIATDPVTAPKKFAARLMYGAAAGFLAMFFRHAGSFEEGACFAILLVNATSKSMDKAVWRLTRRLMYNIENNGPKTTARSRLMDSYELDSSSEEEFDDDILLAENVIDIPLTEEETPVVIEEIAEEIAIETPLAEESIEITVEETLSTDTPEPVQEEPIYGPEAISEEPVPEPIPEEISPEPEAAPVEEVVPKPIPTDKPQTAETPVHFIIKALSSDDTNIPIQTVSDALAQATGETPDPSIVAAFMRAITDAPRQALIDALSKAIEEPAEEEISKEPDPTPEEPVSGWTQPDYTAEGSDDNGQEQ